MAAWWLLSLGLEYLDLERLDDKLLDVKRSGGHNQL
jgi:hypothetical protein